MRLGTWAHPCWGKQGLVHCPVEPAHRFCIGVEGLPGVAEEGSL